MTATRNKKPLFVKPQKYSKSETSQKLENTAADDCQRCFLRLEAYPDHACETRQGSRSCNYCLLVRHRCQPLPDEIKPAAVASLKKTGKARVNAIRAVRQMIKDRSRRINRKASEQAARNKQLKREPEDSL
ncbi:hypothetical protein N7448_002382 [Penicillium atrosanguineum]|uniref:Uncharacterized protein n=1 Tax=Penicillium atrosanguineum TaxID=1132637 RepID=A0A9W9U3T0_9EURO|nr:uncharacterized protein N7443_005784 [Penicillium atrosanguineum]KAJ5128665.1 hypothetical protein N7526_006831 [Penicillium atrosanguineum]KAJ5144990.1 hypothetical protein N7448_002382 [Penicillium atrosanguineum]KAJ5300782.1 hypothetical protein N7443_005784 [Penicillium atrosanguineum]KAJ5311424.1 hypothetical protein N7476_007284 [Penicillium atrosanguineum]